VRVQTQRESLSLAATVMAVRASILDVYMYVGVRSGLYHSTCKCLGASNQECCRMEA
jgi:hypothetical protein